MPIPQTDRDQLARRGLKLTHLRLLAALAETGQVGSAAAQVAITQPAASRLLADLERIVGTPLYARHARGVVLSTAGEALARQADRMLRQLDVTNAEIAQMERGVRGRVSIGSVTGPALDLVLPTLRRTRAQHPEIELAILVETSDVLAEKLLAGEIDLYLGRHVGNVDGRALSLDPVAPEPLTLIARRDHPLTRLADPQLIDCLDYDWVLQPPGGLMRRTFELYLLEQGYALPQRVVDTSSMMMTLAIVGETDSIAPFARSAANFFGAQQRLGSSITSLPIRLDVLVSTYSVVTRRHDPLPPASARVHAILQETIAQSRRDGATPDRFSAKAATSPLAPARPDH